MAKPRIIITFSSPVDELIGVCPHAAGVTREWVENDFGTASFFLAGTTPNLTAFLADGNIVRIYEEGVPTWVGMVDEQQWQNGSVILQLKSAEWFLQGKVTRQGLLLGARGGGASAGSIASTLFTSAMASCRVKNLKAGVFDATAVHFKQYDYADLFTAFTGLVETDGSAFWVDSNLKVHFRNARGHDLSMETAPLVLYENTQLHGVKVTRRISSVFTAMLAMGDGSSLGAKPKYGVARNNPHIFRARIVNLSGYQVPSALVGPARAQLAQESQPEFLLDATMARYGEADGGRFQFAEWGKFWVGDTVRAVLYSMNKTFNARVRVVGIGKDEEDTLRLVVKVISSADPYPLIPWSPA